jgi:hypothetical protein
MKSGHGSKTTVRRRKVLALEYLEGRLTPSGLHITEQPGNIAAAVNTSNSQTDTVSFTSMAASPTGTSIAVQWQISTNGGKTFSDILNNASATTDTLNVVVPSTVENTEEFRAVFTETNNTTGKVIGKIMSNAAHLRTEVPPGTPSNPGDLTVNARKLATFTVADPTGTALRYQWQVSTDGGKTFADIPGAIKNTLSFRATGADDTNEYRAKVFNGVGSKTTAAATLTVNSKPAVTVQPQSQVVAQNATGVTLSVTAVGEGNPDTYTYQWFTVNGTTLTPITGATNQTYSPPTNTVGKTHYLVEVTNSHGTTKSDLATIKVDVPVTITQNPTNQSVAAGHKVTFTAAATGTPSPHVQWLVNKNDGKGFVVLKGATSDTLSFIVNATEHNYQYEAVFTNPLGSKTTTAATLTVT